MWNTLLVVAAAPLFFNIAPYSEGREEVVAADMREYVAKTGSKKVLYSLTLHPEGKPAMAKVERALSSYHRLRELLAGSDVELGILLQAIMGHWPRTDREVEPWQRTIDLEGRVVRFCPLDPNYANYIRCVGAKLAAEKPAFILGDDDIRAFSPYAECFCPLHVAAFNKKHGTAYTTETLRAAVSKAHAGDAIHEQFIALQREQVDGVVKLLREGIDSVDPSIPAGTCMPGWESRFNDSAARLIAARGQKSVMRLCTGNYQERPKSILDLLRITQNTQALYAWHKDRVGLLLAEADTYPHHLWSRSATSWHAHLVMSLFVGLDGAKLWYVNAHRGETPINRSYTNKQAENAGLYKTLHAAIAGGTPVGLYEPCLTNFPNWRLKTINAARDGFSARETWAKRVLGRIGIPFACSREYDADVTWSLAGADVVSRLSDGDLQKLLSHRVLVDGVAAEALDKRGFADLIGTHAIRTNTLFNCEVAADSAARYLLVPTDQCPTLYPQKGARVLSYLGYATRYGSKQVERIAPASTLFTNRLGGRVLVTSYHVQANIDRICNEERKAYLDAAIDVLSGGADLPLIENPQDVMLLASRTQEGALLLAVFNLNFDPLDTIQVRLPPRELKGTCEVLQGDGAWRKLPTTLRDNVCLIPHSIPCYGVAVLRVK